MQDWMRLLHVFRECEFEVAVEKLTREQAGPGHRHSPFRLELLLESSEDPQSTLDFRQHPHRYSRVSGGVPSKPVPREAAMAVGPRDAAVFPMPLFFFRPGSTLGNIDRSGSAPPSPEKSSSEDILEDRGLSVGSL